MTKLIHWLGARDHMQWFRNLYYRLTSGRCLWGVKQNIHDGTSSQFDKHDEQKLKQDIKKLLKQLQNER